jgi:O-antigen ligase
LSSLSVYAVLLVALASTWSRGPWLGAGIFLLSLIALRWVSARTYSFGLISLLLAGVIVKLFGADELIYDFLRSLFGSTEDDFGSIQYRRQLLDAALALIKQSPTFGVPNFGAYLQEFRQGEGIIDLVNTYLMVTLSSGMVGLVLYALPPLIVIMSLLRRLAPPVANSAPDLFVCVFVSVQIAIAFTLITTSTIYVMPYVLLFLMAMPLVYVRILADGMNEQPIAVSAAGPLTLARRNR